MIGIVILNYNGWDITINCIKSLRKNCLLPYKVYLVDNASTERMSEEFLNFINTANDCEFLISNKNLGYSAGNNVGIQKALEERCEYILISNNDVIFSKKTIEKLCDYLDEHQEFGIAGPKIYLPDGNIQEINMGCKMTLAGKYKYLLRKTPLQSLVKDFVEDFHAVSQDLSRPFEVYAVSGCCYMMRRNIAELLFPMDENTFLYEEENIIGCRMERLGFKTVYDCESEIIHLGGETTKRKSRFAYSCQVESEIYYCRKYLKANRILIIPLFCIRTIIFIKKFGIRDFQNYFKRTIRMFLKKI